MLTASYPLFDVRQQIVGIDTPVVRQGGLRGWAVNLDNAAGAPALRPAQAVVGRFLSCCGAGPRSQLAAAYAEARDIVARFVGARPGQHAVVFARGTAEAMGLLARRIDLRPGQVVVSTELEHHANDLPWRQVAPVLRARADEAGALDEGHLAELLREHAGRVRLLAVTGGSNLSGHAPDLRRLAALAHAVGAEIAVDAAQLAPRRPIDMGDMGDPAHLDYVAISGHKLYAPYGSGALIGRADLLAAARPASDDLAPASVVAAVALAAALAALDAIGLEAIAAHEASLTARAIRRLRAVPGLRLYGASQPEPADARLGVIPFSLHNHDPRLVAAILSHEHGIAVGCGCFGAQPYLRRLLASQHSGEERRAPGLLRASLGIYSASYEVDLLADALAAIAGGAFDGPYLRDPETGCYRPRGGPARTAERFHFDLAPGSRLAAELAVCAD